MARREKQPSTIHKAGALLQIKSGLQAIAKRGRFVEDDSDLKRRKRKYARDSAEAVAREIWPQGLPPELMATAHAVQILAESMKTRGLHVPSPHTLERAIGRRRDD
jgi:hypothetical protein